MKKQDEELGYSFSRYPGSEMAVFWHRLNSWVEHLGRQYVLLGRRIEMATSGLPREALTPYNTGSVMRKCLTADRAGSTTTGGGLTGVVASVLGACYDEVKNLTPGLVSSLQRAVERIREIGSRCHLLEDYLGSRYIMPF